MRLELKRNTAQLKRHQYELRAETSTMSYTAHNFGPQLFPRNEGPKLLIGVHDKQTGVVRLVAAQRCAERVVCCSTVVVRGATRTSLACWVSLCPGFWLRYAPGTSR